VTENAAGSLVTSPPPGAHVRGQLLLARLEYLREFHAAGDLANILSQLPDEDQRRLARVDRDAWYSFSLLIRVDKAIAAVLAASDPGIYERLGAASSRHRTEWLGEHARFVSVHGFLSRVADEHSRFQTFGRAAYRRTGFTEGEVHYSEYPELDPVWCQASRGYIRGAIEFLTAGPAVVDEPQCQCRGDAECVYRAKWSGSDAFRAPLP
jgi:hypothetical protein